MIVSSTVAASIFLRFLPQLALILETPGHYSKLIAISCSVNAPPSIKRYYILHKLPKPDMHMEPGAK